MNDEAGGRLAPASGMMRPALTFGSGSAAYAGMVRICQATPVRCFFAALIAFALVLNGMGSAASADRGKVGESFVVIAGTTVTLCQYDGGKGNVPVMHGCGHCALCVSPPPLPPPSHHSLDRLARRVVPTVILASDVAKSASWRASWPRGPPSA